MNADKICIHDATFDVTRIGGAGRDRTDDPLVANQVLSQLSYSPMFRGTSRAHRVRWWVWLDSNQRPPPYQDGALTG